MARSAKIATDSRRTGQDDIEGRNLHRASIFRSILACAIPGDREPEVSTLKNANDYVLPSRGAYFLRFVLGIFVEILSFFFLSLLWFLSIVLARIQKNYCRRKTPCSSSMICQPDRERVWNLFLLIRLVKYFVLDPWMARDAERLWFTYIYVYISLVLWFFCLDWGSTHDKVAPSCRETMKKTIIIIGVLGEKGENYSITEVYLEEQGR